jgi:hypothetical protein
VTPCPFCKCEYIGLDVIYAEGAALCCQECGVRGPRVPVSRETLYGEQVARASKAWDQWAREQTTLPQGGYTNDELRFSG